QGSIDSAKYYLDIYRKNLKNSNYTGHLDVDKYADVFQLLADISLREHDFNEALRLSKKSLRLQSHEWTRREVGKNYADRIRALNSITTVYIRTKNYRKAKKVNDRATYMLEKYAVGNELLKVDSYLNKSFLAYYNNDVANSKVLLSRSMKLQVGFVKSTMTFLSEYEKENIYQQFKANSDRILSQVYTMHSDGYVGSNDPFLEDILNYVINTKAIILSETNKIIEGASGSGQDSLSELLSNWRQLKQQWNYLASASKRNGQKRYEKADEKRGEINQRIIQIEKELSTKLKTKPTVSWKTVRDHLVAGEVAIEMIKVNRGDSSVFMIMKVGPESKLPEINFLGQNVSLERYVKSYFNAIKYDFEDTLMYPVIWKPLKLESDIKKIYLSPSGIFHLVNFNTIKRSDGSFLTDKHTIVNITNIANLARDKPTEPNFSSALLVGISDFHSHGYLDQYNVADLPGVEREIMQIDSLLKGEGINTISILN
ncbi:MAG: CHAT domain-containing protein, partial [Bacteroidota bacterium]